MLTDEQLARIEDRLATVPFMPGVWVDFYAEDVGVLLEEVKMLRKEREVVISGIEMALKLYPDVSAQTSLNALLDLYRKEKGE